MGDKLQRIDSRAPVKVKVEVLTEAMDETEPIEVFPCTVCAQNLALVT